MFVKKTIINKECATKHINRSIFQHVLQHKYIYTPQHNLLEGRCPIKRYISLTIIGMSHKNAAFVVSNSPPSFSDRTLRKWTLEHILFARRSTSVWSCETRSPIFNQIRKANRKTKNYLSISFDELKIVTCNIVRTL